MMTPERAVAERRVERAVRAAEIARFRRRQREARRLDRDVRRP